MINEYQDGGLKMLDIQSFNRALKAKWVQKYLDDNNQAKWKLFFDYFIRQHDGKLILNGNLKEADVTFLNIQDTFTKEVIEIWSNLNYEENPTYFGCLPIWYNSLVRIANTPIYYRNWACAGVRQIKDMWDPISGFLKYEDFQTRYRIKSTFLTYCGIVSSMKKLKNSMQDQTTIMNNNDQSSRGQKLLTSFNFCKDAYKLIVKGISSTPTKSQGKWIADCEAYENVINWNESYLLPFCCTKESKLQTFQFKFLHRRIATNSYLYKMGYSSTEKCTFCEQHIETLIHLFWKCEFVQSFWKNIQTWLIQHHVMPQNFSLSLLTCLGLVNSSDDNLLHHALLIGRYHIYLSQLNKTLPNVQVFSQTFLKCRKIEKCWAYKTKTINKYNLKWGRFFDK